ncbi:hypothetical protein NCC78_10735 [Micromonospora phytophila]|uniref:hypothetical protein n=1 Tax=Micromonospora phytophila TaxID=709888 RepID=UPI002030B2E8|nr:hypothetical protein [Micromonospora phytophila]MCM0675162.1 hypothetical protein [Micromonospora phytophila]
MSDPTATDGLYDCPACGYHGIGKPYEHWPPPAGVELTPPYEDLLGMPSYEVCERCGFEFGFDDNPGGEAQPESFEQYRQEWVADGRPWLDGRSAED